MKYSIVFHLIDGKKIHTNETEWDTRNPSEINVIQKKNRKLFIPQTSISYVEIWDKAYLEGGDEDEV